MTSTATVASPLSLIAAAVDHWYKTPPQGLTRPIAYGRDQVQPDWDKWSAVFVVRDGKMDVVMCPGEWYALFGGRLDSANVATAPPIPGIQEFTLADGGTGVTYPCWGLPKDSESGSSKL